MKILVTGGTGLIGSNLLLKLLQSGKSVRALKRASSNLSLVERIFCFHDEKQGKDLFNKIEWVDGDILDVVSLEDTMQGIQQVYHCAAMVSFLQKEAKTMMKINVEGTANVVNLCLNSNIEKLCYVSSVAALGRTEKEMKISEATVWKNSSYNTNYAISKYLGEQEVWRGIEERLNAVIVNPTIVIGTGDERKSSAKLFQTVKKGMPFYTSGINGFVDAKDVVVLMEKLMDSEISNERYVTVSENCSYRDVFTWIAKSLDLAPPNKPASPFALGMAWRVSALLRFLGINKDGMTKENVMSAQLKCEYDNSKIKEAFNFEFTPVEQSIKNVVDFYR